MQAPFELNEGLAKLTAILAEFPPGSAHWNEAQNRFQFIDRLLTECLGWERPYVEVERQDESGGKADYLLGRPIRAILEAKRESKRFDSLPVGKPSIVRKLVPLLEASGELSEAARQVGRLSGT